MRSRDDNRCPVIPVFEYLHELSFLHFEKELEAFSIALRFDPSDASPITTPASLKEMRETLQHYSSPTSSPTLIHSTSR